MVSKGPSTSTFLCNPQENFTQCHIYGPNYLTSTFTLSNLRKNFTCTGWRKCITTDNVQHNDQVKPIQWDLMIHGYGRKLWNVISQHTSGLYARSCISQKTECPFFLKGITVVKNMVHFLFVWCRPFFKKFMVPSILC
jgi:hypothetical protein